MTATATLNSAQVKSDNAQTAHVEGQSTGKRTLLHAQHTHTHNTHNTHTHTQHTHNTHTYTHPTQNTHTHTHTHTHLSVSQNIWESPNYTECTALNEEQELSVQFHDSISNTE